ncbi:MAG: hypothetical protein K5681_02415 [Treponema sp.]|nr:hypothetical protein [Treponema sp.]
MKKTFLLFFFSLSFLILSCSKKSPEAINNSDDNSFYVVDSGQYIQDAENVTIPRAESLKEKSASAEIKDKKIDFDLTKMSTTMIYSTVFDMMIAPEDYENKVIKVAGMFNVFTNEVTGDRYYAVIVQDATACCQQGLEFIWLGDHIYPDDYPEMFSEIVITGTYTTTEEDGISYSYIQAWSVESIS